MVYFLLAVIIIIVWPPLIGVVVFIAGVCMLANYLTPDPLSADEHRAKYEHDTPKRLLKEQKQKRRAQDFKECKNHLVWFGYVCWGLIFAQGINLYFNTPHQDTAYFLFGLCSLLPFYGLCYLIKKTHLNNVEVNS